MKKVVLFSISLMAAVAAFAQFPKDNPAEENIRTKNFPALKQLKMTDIPGAPILGQPMRIDGDKKEIRTNKHGLCYPAIYDWNHDGKPDLLLGEFSTGDKENNIRVYLNEGSRKKPKFSGEYFYAYDTKGDIISNHQWCCIGIHPRLVDMDGDGYLDMLSGQYNPGLISLWKGSKDGFMPRVFVEQEGSQNEKMGMGANPISPTCTLYWNYTSAGFADYDGDGLVDLFVGGSAGPRVALNEGTKEHPKFGLRKYLYMVDGNVLSIDPAHPLKEGGVPSYFKTYMTPVDWDGDGVLDILMTYEYASKGNHAVLFYKGVKTNLGLRFKHPVPLFTTEDGSKAMPGCQPMIYVADVNGDGVNDIVMGLSLPTLHHEVDAKIAWGWLHDLGLEMPGKDAGEYYMYTTRDSLIQRMRTKPGLSSYYLGKMNDEKYIDLRHSGYVYLFLGKKNPIAAVAEELALEAPKPMETSAFEGGEQESPVTYHIECEKEEVLYTLKIYLKFKEGWHGYADVKATKDMGMIPTKVSIEAPKGVALLREVDEPYVGSSPIYKGTQEFLQQFFVQEHYKEKTIPVKVRVNYQVCDENLCLPPAEHVIDYEIPK